MKQKFPQELIDIIFSYLTFDTNFILQILKISPYNIKNILQNLDKILHKSVPSVQHRHRLNITGKYEKNHDIVNFVTKCYENEINPLKFTFNTSNLLKKLIFKYYIIIDDNFI